MSLKRNIAASYASQIYVMLVGIAMVPVYLKYMGPESYGLVGFFIMLQAWFQLLDIGLTPTMARETARFNGGAVDAQSLRRLLRALEGIFFGIALLGALALALSSNAIATGWLNVQHLSLAEVERALQLMAVLVALRWTCGLYRGAISGFERLVWLSGFNIVVATARFVLVIPVFVFVGARATDFFIYQLIVAVFELLVLVLYTYRILPPNTNPAKTPWDWHALRRVLKFSMGIAFTSSVWVLVTQTDKLVLSKLLPLTDYAYFTLAVLVASSVTVLSGPIGAALMPRLTRISAEGDDTALVQIYRAATQVAGVIAIPLTLVLALFAEQVLWAWTGDRAAASRAAPVLSLYALGNGILALAAFPYYLQFAKGDIKLHLIGHALFVVLLIPALIWATFTWGIIGAGYAWLGATSTYFVLWVPQIHRRFFKGLHTRWLRDDLGATALLATLGAFAARSISASPEGRVLAAFETGVLALVLLALASGGSSWVRNAIRQKYRLWTAVKA